MIEHIWTVFCSNSVIDKDSNNVSIQDILEQITVPFKPEKDAALAIKCHLITMWGRTDFDKPINGFSRITYVSPSGKELLELLGRIELDKKVRTRNKVIFSAIPIVETGKHYFVIEYKETENEDWKTAAKIPFVVISTWKEGY